MGAQLCTASSGVDDKSLHGVAHNKGLQDKQMREGFIPSGAPGAKKGMICGTYWHDFSMEFNQFGSKNE